MMNGLLFFSTSLASSSYYWELDAKEIENQTAKTFFKSWYIHTTSLTKIIIEIYKTWWKKSVVMMNGLLQYFSQPLWPQVLTIKN